MARHPMSSSWPQLTARTPVSGQSSRLALQEDITVRTAQNTIFTGTPGRRQAAAPARGARHRSTQSVDRGPAPGFKKESTGAVQCY
jgi:hypothetical protein